MAEPLLIIGSYLSPYVRKVLVLLELKGIAYRIDPIVPFFGDEAFERLSPLRQIPVLVDGDFVLNDSSVICQYLEERYPQPSLYPADIGQRAQARWLEEYADSRLGQVIIWQLFHQLRSTAASGSANPTRRSCNAPTTKTCHRSATTWKGGFRQAAGCAASCPSPMSPSPACSAMPSWRATRSTASAGRAWRACWLTLSPCRPSSIWRVSRRPPRRPRSPNSARRCARPARRSARPATPASGRCAVR